MLRRALATAAVSAIAVVGLAPAASAQLPDVNNTIATFPCGLLGTALRGFGLVDEDTTRNQLAAELRKGARDIPGLLGIATNQVAGALADRALECKIVKEDPRTLFSGSTQFLEMFDGLSSTLVRQ